MKIKRIDDENLEFDNGTVIGYYHSQDCCEDVYADWYYLKQYNILPSTGEKVSIFDVEFDDNIVNFIEYEKDMGIKLISKSGDKWFVPCYNVQNGYYNDRLALIISIPNKPKITIDISDYVEYREI